MTAAQKKAQSKFKEAVKLAKKIRLSNPKLSHPEAVKKAFSQLAGPVKPAAKKTAKPAAKKTAQPIAKKKASCSPDHSDNKSHNVNIRVMSGYPYATISDLLNLYTFNQLRELRNEKENEIKNIEKRLREIQKEIYLSKTIVFKKKAKKLLLTYKNALKHYKKQLNSYNKALEKY